GLAGALHAFFKGSVFPDTLGISVSVDGLVMMLLGGIESLSGPLVGAALYKTLQIFMISWTDYWRAVLGLLIIALVVLFPHGGDGPIRRLPTIRGRTAWPFAAWRPDRGASAAGARATASASRWRRGV